MPSEMGTNPGDDLREGKCTLPLIMAMQRASAQQMPPWYASAIEQRLRRASCRASLHIVRSAGALDATREAAHAEALRAMPALDSLAHAQCLHRGHA